MVADGALIWRDAAGLHRTTAAGSTTLISGTITDVFYDASSTSGRVLFSGFDAEEVETSYVYESGAVTTIATDATYAGSSADGGRVWVDSDVPLTAADTDAAVDVYESRVATPAVPPVTVPPTPTPVDTTPPAATVEGKTKQVLDKALEVRVACGTAEPCLVSGTGTLKIGVPAARGNQRFRLKAKSASVAAGAERVIAFKVSRAARSAARAAFRGGGSAKARLKVSVRDAAGNERVIAFRVVAFRVVAFRQ